MEEENFFEGTVFEPRGSSRQKEDAEPQKNAFDWKSWKGGLLPSLEEHSQAKLDILRDYLLDYILICCGSLPRGATSFKIYLVDGFSGGGQYDAEKLGSPLVMLQTIEEAKFRINQARKQPIEIQAQYLFLDQSQDAVDCLKSILEAKGYGERIGKNITLAHGNFEESHESICRSITSFHPRGGARVLFFLDQCGYTQVKPQLVRRISELVPKAEFIVNFSVSWFADYLNGSEGAQKLLRATGLQDELSLSDLTKERDKEGRSSWLFTVESKISQAYQILSGMPFFSPFYICPKDNHRGYWLLHLAPHTKARQAMVSVLWRKSNRVRHYGKTGMEILSYKPDDDVERYENGFLFDGFEKTQLINQLCKEIPQIIEKNEDGTSFKVFVESVCNRTNADKSSLEAAVKKITFR